MQFLTKAKSVFQSHYMSYAYLLFGFLCWFCGLNKTCVIVSAAYVIVLLLICSDIKNAFVPLIYISFFIEDIFLYANWIVYGISIGLVVICFIYYMIVNIRKNAGSIKRGKMFWGFVCMAVAFTLGGLIGEYRVVEKFALVGMVVFGYLIYFICINFCYNLRDFLLRIITFGSLVIAAETIIQYMQADDMLTAIIYRYFLHVGAQNINVASLFIAMGIITCFGLGYKKRKDYIYFAIAIFLEISVCFTFCRMNIVLSGIAFLGLFSLSFVKSNNKVEYCIVISTAAMIALIYEKDLSILLGSFISKFETGTNGRDGLWRFSWEKFITHPIFGVGFILPEKIPSLDTGFLIVHNTVLQYLATVGIVGTILVAYFYFLKYKICTKKPLTDNKFLLILIIFIELTGITDQAATMDAFVFVLVAIIIAAIESSTLEVRRMLGYNRRTISHLYSAEVGNRTSTTYLKNAYNSDDYKNKSE